MEDILSGNFYNLTCGNLNLDGVVKEIIGYMSLEPELFYNIVVGCDSSSGENPNFPIALVILKKGQGGRFFLKKINYSQKKFYGWKERILQEVLLSCEAALILRKKIEKETDHCQSNNKAAQVFVRDAEQPDLQPAARKDGWVCPLNPTEDRGNQTVEEGCKPDGHDDNRHEWLSCHGSYGQVLYKDSQDSCAYNGRKPGSPQREAQGDQEGPENECAYGQ